MKKIVKFEKLARIESLAKSRLLRLIIKFKTHWNIHFFIHCQVDRHLWIETEVRSANLKRKLLTLRTIINFSLTILHQARALSTTRPSARVA